eukprot:scaffold472_cov109-Isochrysis_galbana.AAC.2
MYRVRTRCARGLGWGTPGDRDRTSRPDIGHPHRTQGTGTEKGPFKGKRSYCFCITAIASGAVCKPR